MMDALSLRDLVESTKGENGGAVIGFSHESFKLVSYFIREFSVPMKNPGDELAACRYKDYLLVGKRSFLENMLNALRLAE